MSTIKNPVGPQPPSVYWRRRLLLLLLVVVVIVVVVLIIVRPGSGSPGSTPTGGVSNSASNTPGSGSTGNPSAACDPSVITLVPITDAASYAAGVQPQLSMSITNSGASACTFDVGTDAQVYLITSGADQIWESSKDCQTDPAATKQVLQPGTTLSTTPFAWSRTRSSSSNCSSTGAAVMAGGASYHLSVTVGDAKSTDTKQFVLQ